jgi:hypothetical protein
MSSDVSRTKIPSFTAVDAAAVSASVDESATILSVREP